MPKQNQSLRAEGQSPAQKPAAQQEPRAPENRKVILNLKPQEILMLVTPGMDFRSHLGQFGWVTIGHVHIPYIFREECQCYVAVRIVNQNVLPRFCNIFTQELFDIFVLRSVTITEAERRLYNEINFAHCNSDYGLNAFQRGEQLVKVDDILMLYDLLTFLYSRFILNKNDLHPSFGYMSFDKHNNLVPYYRMDGQPCFPIMYFEGDDKFLQEKSIPVTPFGECVLNLLMKLQHISTCYTQIRVIGFNNLKQYYERNAVFVDCWMQRERDFFINRTKSGSSILKIVNLEMMNAGAPDKNGNIVPVLLMNPTEGEKALRPSEQKVNSH